MAIRVIPLDGDTFERLIALRDDGVSAVAADGWPPATGTFKIQIAEKAEYGDKTWELSVDRAGLHAAEFHLDQPYWVSPTTDPVTGFAIWGAAGLVLAIDPGEIGDQEITIFDAPLPGTPDEPAFWTEMIERILEGAYESPNPVIWDAFDQGEPTAPTGTDASNGDEFEVEVAGARWRVTIGWHHYGTVRYTLAPSDPSSGGRAVEAYALTGQVAQVAFEESSGQEYGALAVPFEMSSNYEFHERPSRLVDFARLTVAALQGDLGQRIVMRRTEDERS